MSGHDISRKQISILYNIHSKRVKSLETGVCRLTILPPQPEGEKHFSQLVN